jgi:hypothetical protein
MKNIYLRLLFFVLGSLVYAQSGSVGIGTNTPNESAILDMVSSNKGLMIPKVSLNATNASDYSFMATQPTISLLVFNTNAALPAGTGLYYWDGTKWVFYFNSANINLLLGITKYYSKIYPNTLFSFAYNSELSSVSSFVNGTALATPWIKIPETNDTPFNIVIDRVKNNTVITLTGMVQLRNTAAGEENRNVNYGLGIFVDNQLISSKAVSLSTDTRCGYQEFTINGFVDDLSVGTHTITFGAMNRSGNAGSTSLYFGRQAGGCENLSDDEVRISSVVLVSQPLPY